jgi:hypothetical protein
MGSCYGNALGSRILPEIRPESEAADNFNKKEVKNKQRTERAMYLKVLYGCGSPKLQPGPKTGRFLVE